ncbi:hypothetical protein QJS10_CPB04g01526 [Acorus calamus]|uniref:Uncharacterized protein n=1 Tax=Acorus calamus TaxID=4465 RepID=A0AAV9F0R5_ACOCL|nr:hypothetical protein QJS10_CPB04g01526 [Acorus calamus]
MLQQEIQKLNKRMQTMRMDHGLLVHRKLPIFWKRHGDVGGFGSVGQVDRGLHLCRSKEKEGEANRSIYEEE